MGSGCFTPNRPITSSTKVNMPVYGGTWRALPKLFAQTPRAPVRIRPDCLQALRLFLISRSPIDASVWSLSSSMMCTPGKALEGLPRMLSTRAIMRFKRRVPHPQRAASISSEDWSRSTLLLRAPAAGTAHPALRLPKRDGNSRYRASYSRRMSRKSSGTQNVLLSEYPTKQHHRKSDWLSYRL
jgi:hypothetical protein